MKPTGRVMAVSKPPQITQYFSQEKKRYSHGVAVILSQETTKSLIGYNPISDRIMKIRIQAKPHNVTVIQCYAPTNLASEEEMESFYNSLQETVDIIPNRDVKFVMGDFNAKVGKQDTPNATCGKFGLGQQNERGEDLIDFCSSNNLTITNTLFQHHPRHLYTWIAPDRKTRNQIDYIIFSKKWKNCLKNVRTRPGADCNSDHQLLTVDIKIKLKKIDQPAPPMRLDYKSLCEEYQITITNKFEALLQCDEEKLRRTLENRKRNNNQHCQRIGFYEKEEKCRMDL